MLHCLHFATEFFLSFVSSFYFYLSAHFFKSLKLSFGHYLSTFSVDKNVSAILVQKFMQFKFKFDKCAKIVDKNSE